MSPTRANSRYPERLFGPTICLSRRVNSYSEGMAFQWRQDMPANLVELAVGKCLIAEMDESRWTELGLVTGTKDRIYEHPRLLRSLRFGDDDYDGHVYDMVPLLLGDDELRWGAPPPPGHSGSIPAARFGC